MRRLYNGVVHTPSGTSFCLLAEMLEQPHLLIAGSTGSGKSVLLKHLICEALLSAPCDKQFILIDPKRVELKRFADLPHTIEHCKTVEEIENAIWGVEKIMDERFEKMDKLNQVMSEEADIYVIIDEYVDIKTLCKKSTEKSLIRISAIGRAAKIHIILCTQRPTRDIINGTIKANFSSVVALRCASAQESRNILGYSLAEQLPRVGCFIFKRPEKPRPPITEFELPDEEVLQSRIDHWHEQFRRIEEEEKPKKRKGFIKRFFEL